MEATIHTIMYYYIITMSCALDMSVLICGQDRSVCQRKISKVSKYMLLLLDFSLLPLIGHPCMVWFSQAMQVVSAHLAIYSRPYKELKETCPVINRGCHSWPFHIRKLVGCYSEHLASVLCSINTEQVRRQGLLNFMMCLLVLEHWLTMQAITE